MGLCVLLWLLAAAALAAELKEPQIAVEKAKLALSAQQYQEAADLLQPVVAAQPDNTEALHYLGVAQIGLKDFKGAEKSLAQALAKDPSLVAARLDRAWALLELKKADEALAELETVLAKEPDLPRAVYFKGHALLLKKDYAGAAAAFDRAAGLDPKLAQPALFYAGVCREKLGQGDKARESFLNAQALDSASPLGKASSDYLDRLEGKGQTENRKRFEASASVLYQYDTNVAAVANDEKLPQNVAHRQDSREVLLVGLLGRPLLTKTWTTEAGYYFYASQHAREDEYNLMMHQGILGGTYRTSVSRYPLQLRLRAQYQWAGLGESYDYYSTIWRLLPSAFLQENNRSITELNYAIASENFAKPGEGPLNRNNLSDQILLAQYLGFFQNRAWLKVGARLMMVNADGQEYDSNRYAGLVELRCPPWKKAEVLGGFQYEYRDYFRSSGNRRDEVLVYSLRLDQEIVKHLSAYVSADWSTYNSTLQPFDYQRDIYTVGVTGRF